MASSRAAEKAYLRRAGDSRWERLKPFAPPGEVTIAEGLHLIQDFGAAVALLDVAPHHRVLDLGAGACWAADWLQRLGVSVVAADLSLDLLAVGRERLASSGPARLACSDAEALPFRDASFDRVLCLNAMHHVPHVPAALREVWRVLAPDGRAVFAEPGAGHASQPHAKRAVEEFGVQEADIDPPAFLQQCLAAGFSDAVLEPFAHVVPGHGLTLEHWTAWSARAAAARPLRALRTLRRAILELIGARKDTELFGEAFASEALRVLAGAMRNHPIVVASKQPVDRFLRRRGDGRPALRAAITVLSGPSTAVPGESMEFALELQNAGTSAWSASPERQGHVTVGVQLLDAERRLLNRDFARQPLHRDVMPDETIQLTVTCAAPAGAGAYFMKFDLVSEGIAWFEPYGGAAPVRPLRVTVGNRVKSDGPRRP